MPNTAVVAEDRRGKDDRKQNTLAPLGRIVKKLRRTEQITQHIPTNSLGGEFKLALQNL
jgi:hypothetical protein